jgi:hypothetical protein
VTTNPIQAYKWFRLLDDLTFASDGTATPPTGEAFINRGGRYSWAYLARRSSTTYGTSTQFPGVSDLAAVVYDNRNLAIAGGESVYVPAYPGSGNTAWPAATTSITLQYSGAPLPFASPKGYYSQITPQIRRGSWILDASPKDTTVRNGGAVPSDSDDIGNVHSFFYRIVDYNDNGSSVQLDLEQPLVAAINGATQADGTTAATNPGIIVILENVANVYERRTGWRP